MKLPLVFWATVAMLMQQALSSMAGFTIPVLVPPISRETGLDPGLVGLFVPLVYGGSMISSILTGGLLLRLGAFRVSQICLLTTSLGLLICTHGSIAMFVLGGFILGLGNGPSTPAGSHVLARYTTPRNAAMLFAVKQTGVPVGGMMAGALLPIYAAFFDWRGAIVGAVLMSLAFVILGQPLRREFDSDRQPGRSLKMMDVRATLTTVLRDARIRRMAITIFVFTGQQVTFASFFVSFVSIRMEWTLAEAGGAYSIAMISGIGFRLIWSWLASRLLTPVLMLGFLGVGMAASFVAIGFVEPDWSRYAIWAAALLFGATGIGFQGVLLAEVARLAPHGMAGVITGGTVFFAFVGMILFPASFGVMLSAGLSYESCFLIAGVWPAIVAAMLLTPSVRRKTS